MGDWRATQIAPNFTVSDWFELRDQLDAEAYDADWKRVIGAVQLRLTRRFVEPADVIIDHDEPSPAFPEGRGFAVLALDCLLIEAIYGYKRGRRTNVGESGRAFEQTLRGDPRFASSFSEDDRAHSFYISVRNGLLHDGETRKGWVVWKGWPNAPLVMPVGDGRLALHRDAFHVAVKAYLADYIAALRDPAASDLRDKLRDRIEELCKESAPPDVA